ncbi:DUF421 domain-containing protein [Nonomuraea sp. NPDC050663]|uniref:DUF421 domain-containing protein n=1 Tax=Nonomuraea sp. NPDC050663 TaxID=3364370 RepID=UPI003796E116
MDMWNDLLVTGVPLLDKAIRTVCVYLALAVLLRLAGKRELAQLTGFDLVVMLLLSNVVQNAVIGPDNSLWGGLFGAVVLLAANAVTVRLAEAVPLVGWWFKGKPTVLAADGAYIASALRRLGLRRSDVDQAILQQGGSSVADTQSVTLEPGGALLVRLRPEEENVSVGDLAEMRERLDRIERLLLEQASRRENTKGQAP